MVSFKKTNSITGKFKNLIITGDQKFADAETGEYIDVVGIILANVDMDNSFDIAVTQKAETPTTDEE